MSKLSDDLKKILTELARQDAGALHPIAGNSDKLRFAAGSSQNRTAEAHQTPTKHLSRRIALLTGDGRIGAAFDYAIECCIKQQAKLDLLIESHWEISAVSVLQNRAKSAQLQCQLFQLGQSPIEYICDYISEHPSLIFIISDSANELIRDALPKQKNRIHVPLVLIEDKTTSEAGRHLAQTYLRTDEKLETKHNSRIKRAFP